MEKKNLALEALKKLLAGEITSRMRTNVVESRAFSRRLEDAVARYHAGALSAAEMINELIALAKDMKAAQRRGGHAVGLARGDRFGQRSRADPVLPDRAVSARDRAAPGGRRRGSPGPVEPDAIGASGGGPCPPHDDGLRPGEGA